MTGSDFLFEILLLFHEITWLEEMMGGEVMIWFSTSDRCWLRALPGLHSCFIPLCCPRLAAPFLGEYGSNQQKGNH